MFLHTSPAHVDTFERLLRAADRTLRVEHRVEEGLLTEAQRLGADDPALIARVQGSVMSA